MREFVVVGAGPAGSHFARRAADAGHDVLVLERGTIGRPLACSGHVSRDLWEFVEGAREDLLQHEIGEARFHLDEQPEDGYPFRVSGSISDVIDRVKLDQTLAERAQAAGADVRDQQHVISVDEGPDSVTVTARGPDGIEEFHTRIVVGSDGPRSRVRRELGLSPPSRLLHGVFGYESTPDHDPGVDVHLTTPGLFAWRIPRGAAGCEYGIAAPPGADVRTRFHRHLRAHEVDPSAIETYAGGIPIGPPPTVTSERGLLIGDAAGQTKPFTGGGIVYGLTCAEHAATTVDPWEPDSLDRYERAWRRDIGPDIRLGEVIRRAYRLPTPIRRLGLRLFSGSIDVEMDRPASLIPGRG